MEVKLLLTVFMLLVRASLSVWQRVTVMKGHTLHLSCPITNHKTMTEWRNPKENIMFFNGHRVLKNKRYRIDRLSMSEFSISISNVTFKDGGIYTCSHYGDNTIEKKVEVTVLGLPKISVTNHEGQLVVKCTAEGNHHPPQISWTLDHGPEFQTHAQVHVEEDKFVSTGLIHVQPARNGVTVKCLARHPALHSPPLMDFKIVRLGRQPTKLNTTTVSITHPQGSAEVPRTTNGHGSRHEDTTTVSLTITDTNEPPSAVPEALSATPSTKTITAPTRFHVTPVTSTGSHLSTTNRTSVSETTEEIVSYNGTEKNTTGSIDDPRTRRGNRGNSSLLIFLVTCLIFFLLVVVIFFAIKLRRAHNVWRKENEESDPSEDSSKSKSSNEDKNGKGQRQRGLFNITQAFTQYVTEEPVVTPNPDTMTQTHIVDMEQTLQPQISNNIKETEL
ncbi:cytotoxic and regulatory T-cell molecule isoform X2 [Solea senegalensis]|uniref:Cytotoxic and regulatory T-cell molecule isoform X2 n=3 Tax=Solea senegalensis TaxID=28829 RepID=A0AAV6SDM0_SOLSE|nr:cytotoxic and regulatory T-cell molecule isoform X2 [Solea senegalensis]KAG7515239.1 cytotoxic and regulatory T-cell molecule isoform X2 [Solea senegalensis]